MTFLPSGNIGVGSAGCERFWDIYEENGDVCLEIASEEETTCVLRRVPNGSWRGRWLNHEKMAVDLVPLKCTLPRNGAQRIVFSAPINGYTGYGLHACEIVRGLIANNYDVVVRPSSLEEKFAPIPPDISEKLVAGIQDEDWELALRIPPDFKAISGKRNILITMWETDSLPPQFVSRLNEADHIIVPSNWNRESFKSSGVTVPIHVVPLGIRENVFCYSPMNMVGPCTFGAAGRIHDGGIRKGMDMVISAFQKAFPFETDVRLRVKAFPDCEIMNPNDRRITITQKFLTEPELADWFGNLTCFVSGSKGEGWGLMQHQALASGRPVIGAAFGGLQEFFDERVGYPLKFDLLPAQGRYQGCGNWAEPDETQLIDRMRRVYKNRGEARLLGKSGAERARSLNWEHSTRELLKVLCEIGVVR